MNRAKIEQLSSSLLELHKVLIESVRAQYERKHGPVGSPFALLRLLTGDGFFAWLRPLSRLLADIDELLERTEAFSDPEAGAIASEVHSLIDPCEECPTTFTENYLIALQEGPAVILAHGRVGRALMTMPRPVPGTPTLSEMLTAQRAAKRSRRN